MKDKTFSRYEVNLNYQNGSYDDHIGVRYEVNLNYQNGSYDDHIGIDGSAGTKVAYSKTNQQHEAH